MQKKNLLGAHMSISGGVEKSLYRGASIGCTAIQIFTGSNRRWEFKKFNEEDITLFNKAKSETGINNIISHASYLINIASTDSDILKKSIDALKSEIFRCLQLDIKFLVLHPGSAKNIENSALDQVVLVLQEILENYNITILLENTAGQGSVLCYSFEQIAYIIDKLKNKLNNKIGVCFDTCHAWAAGYDFSTPGSYSNFWNNFDKLIGIDLLKAIHVNDSVKPKDSRVDRHQDIGLGTIPIEAFKLLVNDPRFYSVAKILETPKDDDHELKKDKENLDKLRSLIESN